MGRLTALLLLVGCTRPGGRADPDPVAVLGTPSLTEAWLECDEEAVRWTIRLATDAWTGGALSAWSEDGEYVELHDIPRVEWAEDGSSEVLKLVMGIADDWREVTETNTVFTCGADPSGVLELYDRQGEVVACRAWGPDPALFDALEDTPSCDIPIEVR